MVQLFRVRPVTGDFLVAILDEASSLLEALLGDEAPTVLAEDVTDDPLVPVDGQIVLRPVTVSAERLAALAAPPEQADWWRRRIARVAAVAA